jgi:hypothetical protein
MSFTRMLVLSLPLALLSVFALGLAVSCDGGGGGAAATNADVGHEGQGEEVSADPQFEIRMKVGDGADQPFSARSFAIYQAKPAKGDEMERPQTFELRGENFTIAGRLPETLKLAPQRKFAQLVGQALEVRSHGGDPTAPSMSKITTPGGKVYVARGGTLTIEKAFHRKGQYAGVSGKFEVELQEIKLGDPDDPDNKEDKPVGEPVKATGTFTARADSYPFEQL